MKAFFFMATIIVLTFSAAPSAFANAVHSSGGKPTVVSSNPGSAQAQADRSPTGTANKTAHDGYRELW